MKHKPLLAVLVCWILSVLFFGGSPGNAADEVLVLQPDEDGVQRATIVLDSYAFTPRYISIQAGVPTELRLENQSFLTPHNFVIDHSAVDLQHDINVSAGESVMIQFLIRTPGTYTFYCDKQLLFFPSHREEGMEGRLEVRPENR